MKGIRLGFAFAFAIVALCSCAKQPRHDESNPEAHQVSLSGEEDCAAPTDWFAGSETPEPLTAEPKADDDCEFYQRAWQQFLRATDGASGSPRFVTFDSYADVFGADRLLGLLPTQATKTELVRAKGLILAPRLIKSRQPTDAEDVLQAGSSAILIDQSGHPIYYSISLNPTFAAFVRTKHYNDIATLKASPAEEELPVGTVEYKAAWQIVDPANPPRDRIVVSALAPWLIADPSRPGKLKVDTTRPLRPVTVALIGLHVVFLPSNHPEMVWATFEYDRNAPSIRGNPAGLSGSATCKNPKEPSDETVADDGKPYILYRNGTAYKDANKKPASLAIVDAEGQTFAPRTSIVRAFPFSACAPSAADSPVDEVDPAISSLNGHVKKALGPKPWLASYSLVGAVWQNAPRSTDPAIQFKSGKDFPDAELGGEDRLSSTSMESFTQTFSPNCFACHDTQSKGTLDPKRISVSHLFRRFSLGPH
jgi:hypothetical protein